MRILILACTLALAGCEVFEPYSIQYDEITSEDGVHVYANHMEDVSGSRWIQFSASNHNTFPVCVQIQFQGDGETSGHSMGQIKRVSGGDSLDIGYVTLPASFGTTTSVWTPDHTGECGYPPD